MNAAMPAETSEEAPAVEAIYAAALDADAWPAAVALIATRFRGAAAVFEQDRRAPRIGRIVQHGFADGSIGSYRQHFCRVNPIIPLALRLPLGAIGQNTEMIPQAQFERTEYCADWMGPQDLHFGIGAMYAGDDDTVTTLCMMRSARHGDYESGERRRLAALVPHLRRGAAIARRLGAEAAAAAAGRIALDRLGLAALLLDRTGRILDANEAGRALLDGSVRDRGGRLTIGGTRRTESFRRSLAAVADGRRGLSLDLPPDASGTPREALLVPLPATDRGFAGLPAPLVMLVRSRAAAPAVSPALSKAYGLTATEARLLSALVAGERLDAYCARQGVSRNTAKTQLSALFQKTGTTRQADLIRLVLTRGLPDPQPRHRPNG